MSLYDKCKELYEINNSQVEICTSITVKDSWTTLPQKVVFESNKYEEFRCNCVYYISDIHLLDHIIKKFRNGATDKQIKKYISKLTKELFSEELISDILNYNRPKVLFGGDISAIFEIAKIFYTEFVNHWERIEKQLETRNSSRRGYIYAVLGNHEFWDFSDTKDCRNAYGNLFEELDINFLDNKIDWFGTPTFPSKREKGKFVKLDKEKEPKVYQEQMLRIHNTIIVGGTGFAGKNVEFNANNGIYRGVLTREEEKEETIKWNDVYNKACEIANATDCTLIVLTHNPYNDWCNEQPTTTNCIYFYGHNHRNYVEHNEERNIHIFADNQIGNDKNKMAFKKAYIYKRSNPFAGYSDGCYEITSRQYARFYDYCGEYIGVGTIDLQANQYNAKLYMIKKDDFYGFFLRSPKNTYICAGGSLRKIGNSGYLEFVNDNFNDMVNVYLKLFSPYRRELEKISSFVKKFGGSGKVHGCIVDIDFFNHIQLNPYDATITYYYSPSFGLAQTYESLPLLLKNQNPDLLQQYNALNMNEEILTVKKEELALSREMEYIEYSNSLYPTSRRFYQIQRLFDKGVLREWNDNLLLQLKEYKKNFLEN